MDIDMGMARIVMRVGRLCLQEYGMKMALHVKHKYLSWRIVAIATVTVTVTVRNKTKQNKIKINTFPKYLIKQDFSCII